MEAIFLSLLLTVIENIVQKDSINFKCQKQCNTGRTYINLFWRCNQMWIQTKAGIRIQIWCYVIHTMQIALSTGDMTHTMCSWSFVYMFGITIYCQENIKIECNYSMKIRIFCWLSMQKMLEIVWIEWHFCQERTQRRLNSKDSTCVECVRKLFSYNYKFINYDS